MRVVRINDGVVEKSVEVKGGWLPNARRMFDFVSKDEQQREMALMCDAGRELFRFTANEGSVEVKMPGIQFLGVLKQACRAYRLEQIIKQAAEGKAESGD